MITKNTYKIDIEGELERINRDIDDMEEAGMEQIVLDFFGGSENEREFIFAARAAVKARGYAAVHEYDDGDLVLIIRKAA